MLKLWTGEVLWLGTFESMNYDGVWEARSFSLIDGRRAMNQLARASVFHKCENQPEFSKHRIRSSSQVSSRTVDRRIGIIKQLPSRTTVAFSCQSLLDFF